MTTATGTALGQGTTADQSRQAIRGGYGKRYRLPLRATGLRVPTATLLCVSINPCTAKVSCRCAAGAFLTKRAVTPHLHIGIAALDLLRSQLNRCTRSKLRSFDDTVRWKARRLYDRTSLQARRIFTVGSIRSSRPDTHTGWVALFVSLRPRISVPAADLFRYGPFHWQKPRCQAVTGELLRRRRQSAASARGVHGRPPETAA